MNTIYEKLCKKPDLFEQSERNIWDDPHISKGMLQAHLDETQDAATRKQSTVIASIDWITQILEPTKYPKLLDLGCGPGIYAERFHHAGYTVTGIDLSPRTIAHAKASAQSKQLSITYHRNDYTKMRFLTYDLITMIFCDFGVLAKPTRIALLKKIYEALEPQGVFLFDVFCIKKYENAKEYKQWQMEEDGFWKEGKYLLLDAFYTYPSDHTYLHQYTILSKHEVRSYHVWEHVFSKQELEADLKAAGFQSVSFYRNLQGVPCQEGDDTLCILAKKSL